LRTVILDTVALGAAAASIGIHDRAALVAHLGMELEPVTPLLIATIVLNLPISAGEVCAIAVVQRPVERMTA